jgi:uncharacterized protein
MAHRRLAVVTGASSGIGAATAAALADDGWRVILVARGEAALQDVQARIAAAGGDAVVEPANAADGDAMVELAGRVLTEHGVPEAIVNSAGAGRWHFIEDTSPAEVAMMMGAPFFAAFHTTHAFMAPMLERRRGVFVHVGSPASIIPWPGATAYTCSRWALRGLHEALRQDLRGTGLTTSHVLFGPVASGYWDSNPGTREAAPEVGLRLLRELSPAECARVICDVIRRPRAHVVHPPLLRAMQWSFPPLTRWAVARTSGARRGQRR